MRKWKILFLDGTVEIVDAAMYDYDIAGKNGIVKFYRTKEKIGIAAVINWGTIKGIILLTPEI